MRDINFIDFLLDYVEEARQMTGAELMARYNEMVTKYFYLYIVRGN